MVVDEDAARGIIINMVVNVGLLTGAVSVAVHMLTRD